MLIISVATVQSAVIHIPEDYPKVQLGIEAASNGDTVLVADGHYFERLRIAHKGVFVVSYYVVDHQSSHITNTIIDADPAVLGAADSGSVVRFFMTDAGPCGLTGLTLQNGIGSPFQMLQGSMSKGGGGVHCFFGYPFLDRIRILNCTGEHGDGVLSVAGSSAVIRFSVISGEVSCIDAASVFVRDSSQIGALEILGAAGNVVVGSRVDSIYCRSYGILEMDSAAVAGNIQCLDSSMTSFSNCVIGGRAVFRRGTQAALTGCQVGGVSADSCLQPDGDVALEGCLVTGPSTQRESDLRFSRSTLLGSIDVADAVLVLDSSIVSVAGGSIVTCSGDVMAGVQGYAINFYGYTGASWFDCANIFVSTDNIINVNPRFCNPAAGDYHIADSSVCAPRNNDFKTLLGAFGVTCGCCQGITGNVNVTGIVDLADLSPLVSYLTGGGFQLVCETEANVNGRGIIDLADLSSLISFLTGGGYGLPACY